MIYPNSRILCRQEEECDISLCTNVIIYVIYIIYPLYIPDEKLRYRTFYVDTTFEKKKVNSL